MAKKKTYKYIKYGNIVCRYPYYAEFDAYGPLGEVFNIKEQKWDVSSSTIANKNDDNGEAITEKTARKILKIA